MKVKVGIIIKAKGMRHEQKNIAATKKVGEVAHGMSMYKYLYIIEKVVRIMPSKSKCFSTTIVTDPIPSPRIRGIPQTQLCSIPGRDSRRIQCRGSEHLPLDLPTGPYCKDPADSAFIYIILNIGIIQSQSTYLPTLVGTAKKISR